jgi:hypothetical protein
MMRHIMPGCSAATLPCRKPLPAGDLGRASILPGAARRCEHYLRSLDLTIDVSSVSSVTLAALAHIT